jgi:hypothetical protein
MNDKCLTISLKGTNTTVIQPKSSSSSKPTIIDDAYVEILPENLKYMLGSWIKYYSKCNFKTLSPGGVLIEISYPGNQLFIRTIKGEILKVKLSQNTFLCKNDSEAYRSMQELLRAYEKLEYEKKQFRLEKINFYNEKKLQNSTE